ncbi:zinc-binding dehydrogenase [Pseudosulfitobacter pseudonitzschiae]|uniref:zinc-binding dehydrogenase n=1 Tax=Pseudosulfitobacter pseudonitzschiae TaxID=1402135 RepID=UPI001AFA9143|nr:zinc-binding dehydrogenase [Pseudosulfitobacter pseudonitzschiae]MBM1814159.1 zinc-binding dehydrogenase [Pseudosulfitobacter pseudonitzschiae]MBM1831152.1 zinc-binding dehydrogenase [Pseudosulfitobacter pseudonitzschiae]MBM1836019.1 zinc-binding dehydrogenase [Pseudosulfitobacter pseudonitzschiae]MBM1840865.1 zinc-binding dehydrogenase [Pseudosulfitobacter pseudonitzschiae]MBM1845147.1 zinc-binding dehydrogenase [Pseudosulfitobacter pseudonitzschiae]
MKAAIHDTFGEPVDVLENKAVDTPTPAAGEVRIKTVLSPIHNHDLWTIRGNYGYKPELPGAIGGSEALGTIDAVGDGVDEKMIGQRVTVAGVHGTWAEYFIAPAAGVLPLPDVISDTLGAQLIAMPFSAISLLEMLQAKKGDWIVQTAANGSVGKIMAVLAKARGINLLSLVRRADAVTELTDMGIDNVFSTSDKDWKTKAQTLIGKSGAVSAIDSVGGELAADLTDLLGANGELVVFGTATGTPLTLSSGTLIMKQITVKGFWGAKVSADMDPALRTRLITELVTLAAQGTLTLEDGGVYGLDQLADAMKAALTPGRAGKVMLRP